VKWQYDAIFLAVYHDEFKDMNVETIKALGKGIMYFMI